MTERGVDPATARTVAANAAAALPQVSRVYTRDQLLQGNVPPDVFSQRIVRSHHVHRSGDLEIVLTRSGFDRRRAPRMERRIPTTRTFR